MLAYNDAGELIGIELLRPSAGVDLTGIPNAQAIAAVLTAAGMEVRRPTAA